MASSTALEWAAHTAEGNRYGKLNQDCSLVVRLLPSSFLFGVFDGHGELGELASRTAAQSIASSFGALLSVKSNPKEKIAVGTCANTMNGFEYTVEEVDPKMMSRLASDPTGTLIEVFRKAHRDILALRSQSKLPKQYTLPFNHPITFDLIPVGDTFAYANKKKKNDVRMISFGTTAAVAIVHESCLYTATVGDSSIFLAGQGNSCFFATLSTVNDGDLLQSKRKS